MRGWLGKPSHEDANPDHPRDRKPSRGEADRPARHALARLRSGAKSFQERVLATWSGVSQARRAVAIPYWRRSKLRAECASESTSTSTPAAAAARAWIS